MTPLHFVVLVCDTCQGTHLHVQPWCYDTEKAVDEAVHGGLWRVEDDAERTARCGAWEDAAAAAPSGARPYPRPAPAAARVLRGVGPALPPVDSFRCHPPEWTSEGVFVRVDCLDCRLDLGRVPRGAYAHCEGCDANYLARALPEPPEPTPEDARAARDAATIASLRAALDDAHANASLMLDETKGLRDEAWERLDALRAENQRLRARLDAL